MKILIFSDLHAHQFSEFAYINENGINSRLQASLDIIDQIKNYCIEYNIKHVLFAGDLFHTRPSVDTLTHYLTLDKLISLSSEVYKLVILPGNHDSYTKNIQFNSLRLLENIETICILNSQHSVNIQNYSISNEIVNIVPLEHNGSLEYLEKLKRKDTINILLSHNEFIGSQTPAGYIFEDGLDSKPLSESFDFVFNGHIHKYQQFQNNVFNIGSPLHQDWGDKWQDKGFLILNTETKNVEFIKTKYPEFREINESELTKYEGDTYNYYKINFDKTLKEQDIKSIKEKFRFCILNYQIKSNSNKRANIELDMSWDKIVKNYVKNSNTKLDKKILIEKGIGIVNA